MDGGPLTLLDIPPKIIVLKKKLLEQDEFDPRTSMILYLALLSQGLIIQSPHAISVALLLELSKKDKVLAEYLRIEETNNLVLIKRLVSEDYCSYISESSTD